MTGQTQDAPNEPRQGTVEPPTGAAEYRNTPYPSVAEWLEDRAAEYRKRIDSSTGDSGAPGIPAAILSLIHI